MRTGRGKRAAFCGLGFALLLTGCGENAGAPPGAVPPAAAPVASKAMPFLGAGVTTIEIDPAQGEGSSSGGRVDFVLPGGPADSAGLREGDIVLTISHKPAPSNTEIVAIIGEAGAHAVVPVALIRGGQRLSLDVTLGERPANYTALDGPMNRSYVERIAGEQHAAADAEKAGGYRTAFEHYVRSMRYLEQQRLAIYNNAIFLATAAGSVPGNIDLTLTNDVARLADIVPKLEPRAAVPSEAERHNRRAIAILHGASSDDDLDRAANEFSAAIYEAPWLADLYLNFGLTMAKAGYPEAAILNLRRHLVLNPNGRDAAGVKEKLPELEVLAEERQAWAPFVRTWQMADGGIQTLSLRERRLVLVAVKAGPTVPYRAGETICSGKIHGRDFVGRCQQPSVGENEKKCFGASFDYDAQGRVEPNHTLVINAKSGIDYNLASCVINSQNWQVYRTFGPAQ